MQRRLKETELRSKSNFSAFKSEEKGRLEAEAEVKRVRKESKELHEKLDQLRDELFWTNHALEQLKKSRSGEEARASGASGSEAATETKVDEDLNIALKSPVRFSPNESPVLIAWADTAQQPDVKAGRRYGARVTYRNETRTFHQKPKQLRSNFRAEIQAAFGIWDAEMAKLVLQHFRVVRDRTAG